MPCGRLTDQNGNNIPRIGNRGQVAGTWAGENLRTGDTTIAISGWAVPCRSVIDLGVSSERRRNSIPGELN
jgi:hypothetical protein